MSTVTESRSNPLAEIDWDYVEFYVGNAKQAAHYYMSAFGFDQIAYAGPETGIKDRVSYLLEQNKLRFLLTASLVPDDEIARHVELHGDGIKDIAIVVEDAHAAFETAIARRGASLQEPAESRDENGRIVRRRSRPTATRCTRSSSGATIAGTFMPGFVEQRRTLAAAIKPGLQFIDHCVGNVGWGEMDAWGDFYGRVFGFSQLVSFDDKDISTEYTALRSKVMTDARHRVKFPINEPAHGKKKSQIEEYLDFYRGAGVQHMAIRTDDIAATIRALRSNGVEFLDTPDSYYEMLEERVGDRRGDQDAPRAAHPGRPRRHGLHAADLHQAAETGRRSSSRSFSARSLSFGKGNFKALFVSIEREQEKRGTL